MRPGSAADEGSEFLVPEFQPVISAARLFAFVGDDFQKGSRRHNPGVEPGGGKVFEIAGHQIGRPGSLSARKEDVVVRIVTCLDRRLQA